MEQDTKRSIRKISYVVDELRKLDPEMPAQRIATYLTIALREGISVVEMSNLTGQSTSSSTRNLQSLGVDKVTGKRLGKNGVGLVRLESDPVDGRKKNCYLTPLGHAVLLKIAHHLGE